MHQFNLTAAGAFYFAAVNQIVVAFFVWVGSKITARRISKLQDTTLPAHDFFLSDGTPAGHIDAGLRPEQLEVEGLSSTEITSLQSRNRDASVILASAPMVIVPLVLTSHFSIEAKWWLGISVGLASIVVAALILFIERLYDIAKIGMFRLATLLLVAINLGSGTYFAFTVH